MIKGLQLTLATVAVAMLGMQALATAPVISDIPSPVVGDENSVTYPNRFVWEDALNLPNRVTDDGGAANVLWSYAVDGTQIYSFNGVAPIDPASEDLYDPTDADGSGTNKEITGQVLQSEADLDTNAATVTIRNVNLSPFGVDETTYPDPAGGPGELEAERQVVTLFASDGSTYTMKEIMVYTEDNGSDHFSIAGGGVVVEEPSFINNTNGWTQEIMTLPGNNATLSVGADGICIEVGAGDTNNIAQWNGVYGIELVDNSVYQVRMTVTSSQTTPFFGPLWDVVYSNYIGGSGYNAYSGDFFWLDNEGGANSQAGGLSTFEAWIAPLAMLTPQWRSESDGAFAADNLANNDFGLFFRVLDATDDAGGYGGTQDSGRMCLEGYTITRYSMDGMSTIGSPVFNDDNMQDSAWNAYDFVGSSTISFDSGDLTYEPTAAGGWDAELIRLEPGDGTLDLGTGSGLADDYPIDWEADTLYLIEMEVSAPDQAGEDEPVDIIQLGMDTPTNEVILMNMIDRGALSMHNVGMPKLPATVGSLPQVYVSLFYSHAVTLSTVGGDGVDRLRPRVQMMNNNTDQVWTDADSVTHDTNTGGITIHRMTVKKVSFGG